MFQSDRYSPGTRALLSGGVTGLLECFVTYPTELIKTQLQMSEMHAAAAAKEAAAKRLKDAAAGVTAAPAPPPMAAKTGLRGMAEAVTNVVRAHGPRGLYHGMSPVLAGGIPKQAARWSAFETLTQRVRQVRAQKLRDVSPTKRNPQSVKLSLGEMSACGFLAGACEAIFAVIPSETVKTKFIDDERAASKRYNRTGGLLRGVISIIRHDGIRGIYQGAWSTTLKQGMNQAIRFPAQSVFATLLGKLPTIGSSGAATAAAAGSSNTSKAMMLQQPTAEVVSRRRKSPFWNGSAGFLAGVASVVFTQPVDVIKTKMQQSGAAELYKSSRHCAIKVYRSDGFRAFYLGFGPRVLRVGCNVALTFSLFPLVQKIMWTE